MAAKEELCIGDYGSEIVLDTQEDITSATALEIVGKKPNGDAVQWPAVLEGATKVKYVTQANDIDVRGTWGLRARVTSLVGLWTGNKATIKVVDPA